ncbi:MAG: diguanylate cyclase [Nitrospirae bacterium]|nr:diguanylate cyclase [Nitrospirota bacterium]
MYLIGFILSLIFLGIALFLGLSGAILSLIFMGIALFLGLIIKRLRESLKKERKHLRNQAVLNDILTKTALELDIEQVVNTVIEGARQLIKSEMSALVTTKNNEVTGFYSTTEGSSQACKSTLSGILKRVIEERISIRGSDITKIQGFRGFPEKHPKIKNILIVPLIYGSQTGGLLMLANRIGNDEFSPEDETLLLSLSIHTNLALEKIALHQEVVRLSNTDSLTGLYNRRAFDERLNMEVQRAQRFNRKVSLIMCDIDFFKAFNDTYGHPAGDKALKEVAGIITKNIRKIDFIARYGGEEFVAILMECPLETALKVSERIRTAVERHVFQVEKKNVSLTISIGIATFPQDAENKEILVERADKALYQAKTTGRNKVSPFMELISLP